MATLNEQERELVALGASIGAGCRPCTHYHVATARKSGLPDDEIRQALEEAARVRGEGGVDVVNVGKRLLGIEEECEKRAEPRDRRQALIYVGAAASCNAGGLLARYVETAQKLVISGEELRSALEISEVVKGHAADFLRHDGEKAMKELAPATAAGVGPESCCGAEAPSAACGR